MADATGAIWRKSTRSGNGGNCVEVATNLVDTVGAVLVRDSKNPNGPVLSFTRGEWAAFVGGVEDGEFSL
ncbi:MAG: DUF397 domain-containing protein [Micromonosporaceae bacterium]|nr:DUF397 domain-containing protein [Micromonosporaceae bacterium]